MLQLIPFPPAARVCDPACGEGAFLAAAAEAGAAELVGMDLDRPVCQQATRLLAASNVAGAIWHGDGLATGPAGGFDVVCGNPPFTGPDGRVTDPAILARYALGHRQPLAPEPGALVPSQWREALFLERFLRLARPGGWVLIILPEGLLANAQQRAVRGFLLARAELHAVIGLPRDAFRSQGTSARTAILVLRRPGPAALPAAPRRVRFADLVALGTSWPRALSLPFDEWRGQLPAVSVVERPLPTLGPGLAPDPELVERLDPGYWCASHCDPVALDLLERLTVPLRPLGELITQFKQGDIPRAARGEKGPEVALRDDLRLVEGQSLTPTGLDFARTRPLPAAFAERIAEARLRVGDLVFTRTGASLGRSVVVTQLPKDGRTYYLNGALDRLRLAVDPAVLCLFLLSRFGRVQLRRMQNGVGQPNLSGAELARLRVPVLPAAEAAALATGYQAVALLHRIGDHGAAQAQLARLIQKLEQALLRG